ncbi:hypothetical protein RMCBS344292_07702 [Rhizopus microsporus]|nr:hypothetical protein RMCBS344292_07702 [Rhizopus microsporus]
MAILHLFNSQSQQIKEQITRQVLHIKKWIKKILLERLIVNRPHPWGLLTTFVQLIKESHFKENDFIRCSPDISRLFDNVSKSIQRMS